MGLVATIEDMPFHEAVVIPAECKVFQMGKVIGPAFCRIMAHLQASNVAIQPMPFVRYFNFSFAEQLQPGFFQKLLGPFTRVWQLEIGFPVDSAVKVADGMKLVAYDYQTVASCTHRGPYKKMASTYQDLHSWLTSNGYRPQDTSFELYLNDPQTTEDADLETKILVPCIAL